MKESIELIDYMTHKSVNKVNKPILKLAVLSFMAGVFIALGAVGNIVSSADLYLTNQGLAKFVGASVFPVGLIVIILLGYELFTSNCMIICGVYDKQVTVFAYIKNLILVLFFNFLGCLFVAYITAKTHTLSQSGQALLFSMAEHKVHAGAFDIVLKGIMCNILVCGASISAYACKDAISKIFSVWFPIMLFIILGYDHIVANMLYLPTAYMLNADITVSQILYDFLFAGIGNFIGGAFFLLTPLYIGAKGVCCNAKN